MPAPTSLHPYTPPVDPVGPTILTEAYALIARRWYAEGKDKGPNSAAFLDMATKAHDAMSPGEQEYASREAVRIEREHKS
jgi:hypothetical protein